MNTYVVPLPSERCTGTMAWAGSFTPGFAWTIAASSQRVTFPRKMPARISGVKRSVSTPARLNVGTTAPSTVGRWRIGTFVAASCSSVIGPSEAPKSTVPSVTCRMPPPLPID